MSLLQEVADGIAHDVHPNAPDRARAEVREDVVVDGFSEVHCGFLSDSCSHYTPCENSTPCER